MKMKIYEAIQMLENMDQNKECTVTFGQAKQAKVGDQFPYFIEQPQQPNWVIGKFDWPQRTEIMCKMH